MKRIFLTILIIFTLLLSACGKELNSTKEQPPKKEETLIETKIENTEIENIEIEKINEFLSIGQVYETMNDLGIFYLYDELDNEYAIICNELELKYFVELASEIKIKPELEDAGNTLFEMKKDGYIITSIILYHQEEFLKVMKEYGYDEKNLNDITDIPEDDFNKMIEEVMSNLSKEEIESIEEIVKDVIGDTKAYYLKSFEIFDNNKNSLNIYSIEDLKEYYNNLILEDLNKYKELLEIEEIKELDISNDDILISDLEEEKFYYYDKRKNIINDSGKVLKVKIINFEPNEEGKKENVNINESYYSQVTSSSITTFGKFGNETFYLWPTESKIELFVFEFIEDKDEINSLLKEESLFKGFALSTINEKEIMNLDDYNQVYIFNDLDKSIEIIGKSSIDGKIEYTLEPNEVISIWIDNFKDVYWTYK